MKAQSGLLSVLSMAILSAMTCFAYDWPTSGTATIPSGTTAAIATDADVDAVAGLSAIVFAGDDSVVDYTNASKPLTLSASVSGAGVFKATSGMLLQLTGDNASLTGHFDFANTPVEVRHRYGLGSSSTAAAKYDRGTNGSLDFYGSDGTIQNDVALEVTSTALNTTLPIQGTSADKLIQNADVTYLRWQGVSFGNCEIISGNITFSTRAIAARAGCELHLSGTSKIMNATEWSSIGGTGTLCIDVAGNAWTKFKVSPWGGPVVCGADNVFGATVPVVIGIGKVAEPPFYLDVGETSQEVLYVDNESEQAAGSEFYSIIKGTSGSLTMYPSDDMTAALKFRGGVALNYAGTATCTLLNQLSDSTGNLSVNSGTLVLDANAGWSGSAVVNGGTLDCRSTRSIVTETGRLDVYDGLLKIGTGVELKVASASVGGTELATGKTYSVAELNAAAGKTVASGEGVLTVVEYEEPDPEGPFVWPDEEGATAIIRLNETVFAYDADVSKVAKVGTIKMRAGSTLVVSNLTQALTLKANITGLGKIIVKDSAGLVLTGDNSGLEGGSFELLNSPVEVRSRYGLGGPKTGICKFDRMSKGTLDFYSATGVITNDVMIDVFTSVLANQNVELHTLSTDTLVQTGGLRFNGYQSLVLGNVTMTDGTLSSNGARQYAAKGNRVVHIAESTKVVGTDAGIGGEGRFFLDVGGHAPMTYKLSKWSGHLVFGASDLLGSSVVLTLGDCVPYGCGDVDLNGHDVTVKYINNNSSDGIVAGANAYSLVKSETPAELTMAVPSGSDVTAAVKFADAVDVSFAGEGAYTLINAVSTSTGALAVCSGSLTFGTKSGWSGTNVTVTGGSVAFNSTDSLLGRKTRLVVTGGAISVASGVELEVASAKFAAAELPEGTYSAAEVNARAGVELMSGAGSVKVGGGEEHFAWPDAPGGAVVVPAGTVGYLEEADVPKVANAATITIKKDATLYVRNGTTAVSIPAVISGSGSIVVDGSAGVTFAGDNSGYAGTTRVTNSTVAVTHRYGLGSSLTPEALFVCTWGNAFTLDFYGNGLTNDVPVQLSAYYVQTLNPATLVQQNSVRRASAWSAPTFGNIEVTSGQLVGVSSAFTIKVIEGAAFTVCGSAYVNTWTWNLGVSGAGSFVFGATSGEHHYGTFTTSAGATLRCAAENALQAPTENGITLEVADEPVVGLDLDGYSQSVLRLRALTNGEKYARVASAAPATLTVSEKASQTLAVSFEGASALAMAGVGTMTLTKRVSLTTGALTVANGSVVLSDGGGWRGDVNVTGGTLSVDATATKPFGARRDCRTALTVSGSGTVDLGEGVVAAVRGLSVGGVTYRKNGLYGSAAAAMAGVIPSANVLPGFTGLGCVRLVGQDGLAVIIR